MSIFENASNINIYGGNFRSVTPESNRLRCALQELQRHSAVGAFYNSKERYDPPKCLPQTREAVLGRITQWIYTAGRTKKPVLWMYGPAGAGKSAIAQTTAENADEIGYDLVATFFFLRSNTERNSTSRFVPSLAYQLLSSCPTTRNFILNAIADTPQIFSLNVAAQLKKLVVEPLQSAGIKSRPSHERPMVFIMDGLDECLSSDECTELLNAIFKICADDTFPIIIFCVSRPDSHIRDAFSGRSAQTLSDSIVLNNDFEPDTDIERYFLHHFDALKRTHPLRYCFPAVWPTVDIVKALVRRSSGQFIYASTVMKFVASKKHKPTDRLNIIMTSHKGSNPFAELDALYRFILSCADDHVNLIPLIGMVVIASRRITPAQAEQTLGLGEGEALLLLDELHSLIEVGGLDDPLRPFHASLGDFITNKSRAGPYHVHPGEACANLVLGTLKSIGNDSPTISHSHLPPPYFSGAQPTETLLDYFHGVEWARTGQRLIQYLQMLSQTWISEATTSGRRYHLEVSTVGYLIKLYGFLRRVSRHSVAWAAVYDNVLKVFGRWVVEEMNDAPGFTATRLRFMAERIYVRNRFPAGEISQLWSLQQVAAIPNGFLYDLMCRNTVLQPVFCDVFTYQEVAGSHFINEERYNEMLAEEMVVRILHSSSVGLVGGWYLQYSIANSRVSRMKDTSKLDLSVLLAAADRDSYIDELIPLIEARFIKVHWGDDGVEELREALSTYRKKPHPPGHVKSNSSFPPAAPVSPECHHMALSYLIEKYQLEDSN